MTRAKKSKKKPVVDPTSHLHVVIDDELRAALTTHANAIEGPSRRPNLSAAVRHLLRGALGLPQTTEELQG